MDDSILEIAAAENPYQLIHEWMADTLGDNLVEALRLLPPIDLQQHRSRVRLEWLRERMKPMTEAREAREFVLCEMNLDHARYVCDALEMLAFQADDCHSGEQWYREWVTRIRLCRTPGDLLDLALAHYDAWLREPSSPAEDRGDPDEYAM